MRLSNIKNNYDIIFHVNKTKTINFTHGILIGQSRIFREGQRLPFRGRNSHGTFDIRFHNNEGMQSHSYFSGQLDGFTLIYRNSFEKMPFRILNNNKESYEISYNQDETSIIVQKDE